ncbi:MAG TPA: hypothetical protein VGE67_07150 [Haloferula sp.]
MEADLAPQLRIPRVYLHGIAFGAMSVSFLLTIAVYNDWRDLDSAWQTVAVAWFPSACVEVFRRGDMERVLAASIILPALVGWELARRVG